MEFNGTPKSNSTWTASGLTDKEAPANGAMDNDHNSQEGQAGVDNDFFNDEEEEDFWDDEEEAIVEVADPFIGLNRVVFAFNDTLYFGLWKPIALAYRAVIPSPLRLGVRNFFYNLGGPVRFVNCLLQGKGQQAENELVHFSMNSIIGVLGFGNPAGKYPELETDAEDLGQTFG
jgi:phospholipid-binding lipoprotein MlaA